jgi:hypothetical protein
MRQNEQLPKRVGLCVNVVGFKLFSNFTEGLSQEGGFVNLAAADALNDILWSTIEHFCITWERPLA